MIHLNTPKIWALLILCLRTGLSFAVVFVDHVDVGFSASNMNFVDNGGVFLQSKNGTIVVALLNPEGGKDCYLCVMHADTKTIVWTANRDSPISDSDEFVFSDDGNAALIEGSWKVWSTGTAGMNVQSLQLQESGNLVILNTSRAAVWQSFDYPTDTLLSGQILRPGTKLVSSSSSGGFSSGPYFLTMESGDLLLLLNYTPPQVYWSMAKDKRTVRLSSSGTPAYARFDDSGLSLVQNDSRVVFQITFTFGSSSMLRRAWLDVDGNLHLLSYVAGIWNPDIQAVENDCSLPLFCGPYGLCSGSGQCACPQDQSPFNNSDWSEGCRVSIHSSCSSSSTFQFEKLGSGVDYFANQFSSAVKTSRIEECQQYCVQNCSCVSFFFYQESNSCFLFPQLGSVQTVGNLNHTAYLKVDDQSERKGSSYFPKLAGSRVGPPQFVVPTITGVSALIIVGMICCFTWWFFHRRQKFVLNEEPMDDEIFLDSFPGLPARFSYKELQIATNYFSRKLGSGGFGSVYEGILPDKSKVAVKRLEGVGQGKREFRAEVAIIGNIHHVHLVQLRGFCTEGLHRLLVYEFMANGSLDSCLFAGSKQGNVLDWITRYNIAIGTARGLTYLHDDCREKILHCDIKPENILLDESYVAKVSDFGLAKLMNKEQSEIFTSLRGTRGYLAPEWLMNLRLSDKSDVYSFGMVLLEIISGRKNFDPSESSEMWYFPAYAFQLAEAGSLQELLDTRLKGAADVEQVVKTAQVALWCIQEDAFLRPSMARVVQMLEGNIRVTEPPLSSQFAVGLYTRMVEAMNSDEEFFYGNHNSQDTISATRLSEPR